MENKIEFSKIRLIKKITIKISFRINSLAFDRLSEHNILYKKIVAQNQMFVEDLNQCCCV